MPNPIQIGGHTDRHPFTSVKGYSNWELSADRANAARRELEANCVKPEQINRITGYADTQPLLPDDPFAQANRRITIMVVRLNGENAKDDQADNQKVVEEAQPSEKDRPAKTEGSTEDSKHPAKRKKRVIKLLTYMRPQAN